MGSKTASQSKVASTRSNTKSTLDVPTTAFYLASHVIFLIGSWTIGRPSQGVFLLTAVLYCFTMFSVTAGYHRMWAHRSFSAILPFRLFTALFGAAACIGPALSWCRSHRAHHRYMDTDKDPMNIKEGFVHAHIGWICTNKSPSVEKTDVDVEDLEKDWVLKMQRRNYLIIAAAFGFILPIVVAGLFFNDWTGGLVYAVLGRMLVVQHSFFFMNSLCHVIGTQNYTQQHSSARSNTIVSFLTFGEGYQNFHQEFPNDYRLGARIFEYDLNKWVIWILSLLGITYDLKATRDVDLLKARILLKQRKIDEIKSTIDFGPEVEALPVENWASVTARVEKGAKLIVIDGIVHDVADFIKIHPGGLKIMSERLGKDTTTAFNGGIYRHTKAARNLAAMMRVSRLPKEEMDARLVSDDIPLVDKRFIGK